MTTLPFFRRINSDANAGRRTYPDARTAGIPNPQVPFFTGGVNYDRVAARDEFTPVSGTVTYGFPFVVVAGDSFNQIGIYSGATGATTPTHQWAGIINQANNKVLAISADAGAAAWGANTQKAFTMGARWINNAADDILAVPFFCVVAATMPTIVGAIVKSQINLAPLMGATGAAGQTTPLALNSTVAAPVANVNSFWCWWS